MTTKIYYSLTNGGDGSVSMQLMESQELATWDQKNDAFDEGWAEDCSGYITIDSESPITIKDKVRTKEHFYLEMNEEYTSYSQDKIDDFNGKFFPEGKPVFIVKKSKKESWTSTYQGTTTYDCYDVICKGILVETKNHDRSTTKSEDEAIEKIRKEVNNE